MHDYLLSSEWVRFAFVLGVAVSMLLYERRHLTTGSIVVPGYIAVFMIHPLVIFATFANAFFTYWLVNHVLRRFFLLYGRTKFTILAATSTIVQTILLRATPRGQWLWESNIPLFIGVGYVVPALIAHDMARQGVWKTTRSVLLAGSLVATPIALALVFDLPGVNDLAPLDGFGSMAIDGKWLPFAVLLSVLASWAVAMNFGLRSGGFIGAAFISMFMGDPWQVAAAIATAALTYLFVTRVLMNSMILFGRRKFSSMLLVSSMISWTVLWLGGRFFSGSWQSHLELGSLALTPLLLPGLLANDAQRTSPRRVLRGVVLGGSFVLTTTWWVQATVTGATLHSGWKLISLVSCGALFSPQLLRLLGLLLERRGSAGEVDSTAPVPEPIPATASQADVDPSSAPIPATASQAEVEPSSAPIPATADPVLAPLEPSSAPIPATASQAEVEPSSAPIPATAAEAPLEPSSAPIPATADPVLAPVDPVPAATEPDFDPVFATAGSVPASAEPTPTAEPTTGPAFERTGAVVEAGRDRPSAPPHHQPAPSAAGAFVPPIAEIRSTPSAGTDRVTPWRRWADEHPAAANDAEAWLDAQLGRIRRPAPTTSGIVDDLTFDVLETALAGARGVAPVPRGRRRNPLSTTFVARRSPTYVPATSGGVREARPAPPDVSDPGDPTARRSPPLSDR